MEACRGVDNGGAGGVNAGLLDEFVDGVDVLEAVDGVLVDGDRACNEDASQLEKRLILRLRSGIVLDISGRYSVF
jgi:hypothetical protein